MKLLLKTEPHGAQKLFETEDPQSQPNVGNRLYTLEDDQGRWTNMTGEELTSLANQWLEYAKARVHPGSLLAATLNYGGKRQDIQRVKSKVAAGLAKP